MSEEIAIAVKKCPLKLYAAVFGDLKDQWHLEPHYAIHIRPLEVKMRFSALPHGIQAVESKRFQKNCINWKSKP